MRFRNPFRWRHASGGAIPGHRPDDSIAVRLTPAEVWLSREAAAHYVWEPGTVVHIVDPWDQCLDVDPFTGQPDHEHGDACESCTA